MILAAAAAWAAAAAGTVLPVSVSLGMAVAGVLLAALCRRRAVAALGVGLALAAASAAWHVHALRTGPVAALAERKADAEVIARLVRDPQLIVSVSGAPMEVVDATVTEVLTGSRSDVDAPVLLLAFGAGWSGLLPGQRIAISGTVERPHPHDEVAAVIEVHGRPTLIGRPPWWQRAAGHARSALAGACDRLPADPRGLLPSLVDGDTSQVPARLQDDLRATGLTHLEAVSGENLTIVLGVVMALVRGVGLRRRSRVALAAAAVLGFVCLARPSPSVLRAAVMSSVALLAMLTGRRTSAVPTLSLAVLALVVVDPFLARAVGFVLSVVATAGIVVLAPGWTDALARSLPRALAVAVAVPAAAQLACTPVLLLAFGQLTPYAVPANFVAGAAVAPATVLGVLGAGIAALSVGAARPIVWLGALPASFIGWTAHLLAALPGASIKVSGSASVALAALSAVLVWRAVKGQVRTAARETL